MEEYATEEEMIKHCDKYACYDCPISYKCKMFKTLFSYFPDFLVDREEDEE